MIGQLTGKILTCTPGQVLLDVTGVGYNLHIPLSTFYELSADSGATVSLHVHTHVRKDALQLFGFASREERSAFESLIGIAGVGPRLALAILSGIDVDELHDAVIQKDRNRLQKIPGIGKKTAERLLLELQDKTIADRAERPTAGRGKPGDREAFAEPDLRTDAISALLNLGYPRDFAERAVDAALESQQSDAKLEAVLRAALGTLVR